MISLENLTGARSGRRRGDLALDVHPTQTSDLVVGSVPPLLAEGWLGLGRLNPAGAA